MDLFPALGPTILAATRSPIETTLEALLSRAGLEDDPLGGLPQIDAFFAENELVLEPPMTTGGLSDPRLLRLRSVLSPSEWAIQIAAAGESATVEFKSSLLVSMNDWKAEGRLVEFQGLVGECLKTVCAFLNADGGCLLVGVDDEGQCCGGIDLDMKLRGWNRDKLMQWWQAALRDRFHDGRRLLHLVRSDVANVAGNTVLVVRVVPATTPAFVKRSNGYEYFVRSGVQTEGLDLPSFYAHIEARSATGSADLRLTGSE